MFVHLLTYKSTYDKKHSLEVNIIIDLRETGSEDMNRIKLVQDRVQMLISPAVVLNICVPGRVRNFLKTLVYKEWQRETLNNYPCNRKWRPIGLRDVDDPTFSRQSVHRRL
jgi:hypothetical protein